MIFFEKLLLYHKFLFLEKKIAKKGKKSKICKNCLQYEKRCLRFSTFVFWKSPNLAKYINTRLPLAHITKLKNKNKNTDLDMSSSRSQEQSGILKISTLLPELWTNLVRRSQSTYLTKLGEKTPWCRQKDPHDNSSVTPESILMAGVTLGCHAQRRWLWPFDILKIKALQEPSDRQSCGMGGHIYHFDPLVL